ncbi:glucokinase-like ROK family protein [Geomicrobium halophilum]|uniref:Glucokinase-like ROK family protein n=1 Tax=Geomicrobium halophilum TaxID=549000 RepID=A0A841PT78_9BACL|nr:ROK family protein [Geomicrobium halophilum]MBB6450974.1 glucokinase-like ROK family protein [Geomicrobium halophilum]
MMIGAFDIGGTNIKYGIVDDKGNIHFKSHVATKAQEGGVVVVSQIIALVQELQKAYILDGVAVSTAGQVDNLEGKVIYATDAIPGYTGVHIKRELEQAVRLPVVVDNDVNCTALGEYWKGAAQDSRYFLCMTFGTGIGGAIVHDGAVYRGASFSAGEFGHMTLYPNGKICTCGDRGCYEMYASSRALEQKAYEHFEGGDSLRGLFSEAKKGEKKAELIIDQWVSDISLGMKTLIHVFNPSLVVMGGGISEQGEYLLEKLKAQVNQQIMSSFQRPLQLKFAQNGNDANLQGAVYQMITA